MPNDGQIVFEVTADGRHAIADIKEITRAIKQETQQWDDSAEEATDNMGKGFSDMLKKVSGAIAAAGIGKALLDIGKQALAAASDLEEVQNVVDTTFGKNSSTIDAWAKRAGTQFGLTETQAKKFASTMGAMMKSSGLAGDSIVGMSTDLAGLAADMASFYNLDFDEAFQKIRSGISGETEPLKQLGINMSVANLEAFALAQGLKKTYGEMTQGEQTMLRYQYLMQATSDAQGDFAKTSDGYANGLRQLQTNLDSLKTKLGEEILPFVTSIVTGINSLFSDRSNDRTVLDDFADIDESTAAKLAQIEQTAGDARELVDQLDAIGKANVDKTGANVQKLATDLSSISFDKDKAGVVQTFIATLAQNIDTIAALQGTDADGAKEWLEGIAASANTLDADDANGWAALIASIKEGLPGLENTDFGAKFFAALGEGFTSVEGKSSVLEWAIDTLGDKTNRTAEEQRLWLEVCKNLVRTIPGLSSIINTETGEVKGGTEAVKAYIKAWEEGKKKLAMMHAVEEKESALSSAYDDLPGLELDMAVKKRRARQNLEQLKQLYDSYGLQLGFDSKGKVVRNYSGLGAEDRAVLDRETNYFEALYGEAEEATELYTTRKKAYKEAVLALEEYRATVEEMPGDVDEVEDATARWLKTTGKTEEEIVGIVDAAKIALAALSDYVEGIHNKTKAEIDSTVHGFEAIETTSKKMQDLTDKMSHLDKGTDEWKELNKELAKVKETRISAQGMSANLEQQRKYMEEYMQYMRTAREKGVSDEILATLSDGSVQSYEYLRALAEASPEEVASINANYQAVIDKKKELEEELVGQQLTVDQTYQALAEEAKKAVEALDLETSAKTNAGKTVAGVAAGITEHLPEVKTAVDAILLELARLSKWGINIGFGGENPSVWTKNGVTHYSAAAGMDYVPYDNMHVRLHEGESVLTAQESAIWRSLRNGAVSGFDLDSLGGVMRDNIKPGGNVYLDGKAVGKVISDRQGQSYRSLQRSGWQ